MKFNDTHISKQHSIKAIVYRNAGIRSLCFRAPNIL